MIIGLRNFAIMRYYDYLDVCKFHGLHRKEGSAVRGLIAASELGVGQDTVPESFT